MTTLTRDVKYGTWWRDYYVFDEISVETAIQDILSDNIDPVLTEPIFGNHDELLEKQGKYYELYMTQFAGNSI